MSIRSQIVEAPTTTSPPADLADPVPVTAPIAVPVNADDGGLIGDIVDAASPLNPIGDALDLLPGFGGISEGITDSLLDLFFTKLNEALAAALTEVNEMVFTALDQAGTVDLAGGWFAGGDNELLAMTTGLGLTLVLAFFFASIIRGMLRGEFSLISRAALVDVPLAIMGTVAIGTFAQMALAITDAATGAMLSTAAGDLGTGAVDVVSSPENAASGGLLQGMMIIIYIIAALVTWFWLLMRSALIYLLLVIAPLGIATRAFPPAANYARRVIDIGIALIVSKFFLAIALAVGAQAFAASGEGGLGALAIGAATMCMAAFMPSVVLKLIPITEGATAVGQVGSTATRAALTGAGVAAMGAGVAGRMSTGGGGGAGGGSEPPTPGSSNPQPSPPSANSRSFGYTPHPDSPTGPTTSGEPALAVQPSGHQGLRPAVNAGSTGVSESSIGGGGIGTISGRTGASGSFADLP